MGVFLSFSMLSSSFILTENVVLADENSTNGNKIELENNSEYKVKYKLRIRHGDSIENRQEFESAYSNYSIWREFLRGDFEVNGNIKKVNGKYEVEIPLVSRRTEENFSAQVPIDIRISGYQKILEDSSGKFSYGELIDDLGKEMIDQTATGQHTQGFVNAKFNVEDLEKPIIVKATQTDANNKLVKSKLYMEYKLDVEDIKSKIGGINKEGLINLLETIDSKYKKDESSSDGTNTGKETDVFNKLLLKDGSEYTIPDSATEEQFEEIKSKLTDENTGIDVDKYSKYIVMDGDAVDVDEHISNYMESPYIVTAQKLNYLRRISKNRKGHYKGIILNDGESVYVPSEEDAKLTDATYNDELLAVLNLITGVKPVNTAISTDKYKEKISVDKQEVNVKDKVNEFKEKLQKGDRPTPDEYVFLKNFFDVLVNSEKSSVNPGHGTNPTDNKYKINTKKGLRSIEKKKLDKVDESLYQEIGSYIKDIDDSKYDWPLDTYNDKDALIKAYTELKKEKSENTKIKLDKPELTEICANKDRGTFDKDKIYHYENEHGIELRFKSTSKNLYNRTDFKFTLDGSEPDENSESMREYMQDCRKLDIHNIKSSNFEPLGNLPSNINEEGTIHLKVKAFATGMDASDTLSVDIKHTALFSENFIDTKTILNGREADVKLAMSGNAFSSAIKGYGMYLDTRLNLDKITSGNQYKDVAKKLKNKGMSVFSLLDYNLVDKHGQPAKIHDGQWKSDKFKFTEDELKKALKSYGESEDNYDKYKDIYRWSLTIDMDKEKDFYPIILDNSKVKIFKVTEDGDLTELPTLLDNGSYINLGLLNGKNKDTKKLCFDINDHEGKIVIAEVNNDKDINALKSEYKKLVDYLNTEKAKARYNKEQLDKLYKDAKAKLGTIDSNKSKEQVKNNLDELKLAITRLDSNYDKPEDIMLKNALAKAKDPVTKVLKTKASKEKLEAVVKKVEEKMSSMTDKDKLASIEEINYAISELKLVNKDFARQPELKDGEYLVPIQMRHFFKMSDTSMGNGAVEGLAKLIVKGDKQELEFNVSGVKIGDKYGRLMKLFYYDIAEGQKADYSKMIEDMSKPGKTITKENTKGIDGVKRDYIRRVSIPLNLDKKNPVRYIGVSVDVMNQLFSPDHKATSDILQIGGLVIDYTQIKPADNKDPQPQPQPDPQPEPGPNTEKEWTVPAKLLHGYVDKDSMGNAALIKTSKIKRTKDGKYTYTINFKGISRNWGTDTFYGHLYGIKVYKDGVDSKLSEELNPVSMTKDKDLYGKEREFPLEYTITRDSLDEVIFVEVAVDAMDMIKGNNANPYETKGIKWKGSQTARLVFDLSSINQDKPKLDENPKVSKEIKDLLAKDIELAESIIKSGVVTGNAKSLIETAIASAKKVLKDPKSTDLNYLTAREVLRFSMANIKKDPNGNNGKVDDNLIDDPNDKDKKDEDKKNKVKKYKVPVKMIQAYNHNKDSMGDKALDREAIIYTKDGKSTIYLGMKGISIMNKYGHLTDMLVYPGSSM